MQNGVPTVCDTDPKTQECVKPYHNAKDINAGGPHVAASATADVDGGCGGSEPDCADDAMLCQPKAQSRDVPGIWNPLPASDTVKQDGQLANIQTVDKFLAAAKSGTLPAVAWIVPENKVSEHPPAKVSDGQAYVTSLINAVMQGPEWNSTAIFLAWDDWGGFYDHIVPPTVDQNGYGLRVPGLVISPYAKTGYIDH
jgi:phospholipase C